jgi:hypothetical protein
MRSDTTTWELSETYARYSFGVDSRRADVIESCFASRSSLGVAGQVPTVGARSIADRLVRVADLTVVHHAFNIVVLKAASDHVVTRADFTMSRHGVVFATGHYDDTLSRDPDVGWVFSRRVVTYTWRAPTE